MKVTQADITRLAKAICASHSRAEECNPRSNVGMPARAIPWREVEAVWACHTTKEKADYRWEAAQALRTIAGMPTRSDAR